MTIVSDNEQLETNLGPLRAKEKTSFEAVPRIYVERQILAHHLGLVVILGIVFLLGLPVYHAAMVCPILNELESVILSL